MLREFLKSTAALVDAKLLGQWLTLISSEEAVAACQMPRMPGSGAANKQSPAPEENQTGSEAEDVRVISLF